MPRGRGSNNQPSMGLLNPDLILGTDQPVGNAPMMGGKPGPAPTWSPPYMLDGPTGAPGPRGGGIAGPGDRGAVPGATSGQKGASQPQPQQQKGATQQQPGMSPGAPGSMTSGRVMPTTGYNATLGVNRGTPYTGGISPVDVNVEGLGLDRYQQFADDAYASQTRRLDPQFDSAEARFRQQMVNQGLAEGTDAYDDARANFDRTRTDAYGQARTMADQLGMAMQQQAFGQNLSESQLANALAQAQMQMDATLGAAGAGAAASMYGSDVQRQLGMLNNQLGWGNLFADTALGFGNLGLGHGQLDLANRRSDQDFYLGLGNLGVNQFNSQQAANQGWMGNIMGLLGMVPGAGIPGIDVQGPYQDFYNSQLNQHNSDQQRRSQNAQYLAWLFCDRGAKDTLGELDPAVALQAAEAMPVDHWRYHHDGTEHYGPYAQDFYRALGLPERERIAMVDVVGVLLGSVKDLARQVRELREAMA